MPVNLHWKDWLTPRLELRGTGIHIVLIEPGPIESCFRSNALAMFQQYVDPSQSPHQETYRSMLVRLQKPGPAAPFTLPATAVAKKVISAIESHKPKSRYPVTFPTYLFTFLKRLLPTTWLDKILLSIE